MAGDPFSPSEAILRAHRHRDHRVPGRRMEFRSAVSHRSKARAVPQSPHGCTPAPTGGAIEYEQGRPAAGRRRPTSAPRWSEQAEPHEPAIFEFRRPVCVQHHGAAPLACACL